MKAAQKIQSYADHIIEVEQRLLTAELLDKGRVLCIVLDDPKIQQDLFLSAGHKTFYVKAQPNAYVFHLKENSEKTAK